MKLGEGGEAFFVFETSEDVPESLQTSPVISPAASPQSFLQQDTASLPTLQEPEYLDLNTNVHNDRRRVSTSQARPVLSNALRAKSDIGMQDVDLRRRIGY
jgi:phosphatidate phosphatase LPIN